MARTLETIAVGTPVYSGEELVGEVRGLYSEGTSRAVEWVVVGWQGRGDLAIPATQVESVEDSGVRLMHQPHAYDDLPQFDAARFPTARPL